MNALFNAKNRVTGRIESSPIPSLKNYTFLFYKIKYSRIVLIIRSTTFHLFIRLPPFFQIVITFSFANA